MRVGFALAATAFLLASGCALTLTPKDRPAPATPAPTPATTPAQVKTTALAAKPAEAAAPAPAETKGPAAPAAPFNDAQFFAELGYKDYASAADTARALTILVSEGKETGGDFETCRTYLKGHGVLPDGWLDKAKSDEPVDKSRLAVLLCRALHVKGGLWMRLLGPLPRLAQHECVYHELMADGAEYAHVTGGELVGAIDRADRYLAKETDRKLPELEAAPIRAEEGKK